MEKDNDIKGDGMSYTTENRGYDSRLGRWLSVDPVIKHDESPYVGFHNSPILFNDPLGDDPPKKAGFWQKLWRAANNDYYKNRAERYAIANNIDESNIIDVGKDTWVVINDKDPKNIKYSIFRKARPGKHFGLTTSSANDDVNLSTSQLLKTHIQGNEVMDAPIPIGSAVKGAVLLGGKSKIAIIGVVDKVTDAIESYKKFIRFGVSGHPDVLKKGFHLHFDDIAEGLELGLRPLDAGKIGFIQVGRISVGTANDIKKAVTLFNRSMANPKFRAELIVRLKVTQEYLKQTFKYSSNSQLAIDKAHELNYLIKAVEKF